MEMEPDKILERAKLLPIDDARRKLASDLRKSVELGEVEFDEREKCLRIADQIEALCTTPDAPVIQQTLEAPRPTTSEEMWACYGGELMSDIVDIHNECIAPLFGPRVVNRYRFPQARRDR